MKGPQELAHSQSAVVHTSQSKPQVPVKTEVSNRNLFQNLFSNKEQQPKGEPPEPKGARFFGEIWIRPGRSWFSNKAGHTLEMAQDDAKDDDPNSPNYHTLKSMYHGVAPQKNSGGKRIYKLVWTPCPPDPALLKALRAAQQPTKADPLP